MNRLRQLITNVWLLLFIWRPRLPRIPTGSRWVCPGCAWSWEKTRAGWYGPWWEDGKGYPRPMSQQDFEEMYADCWGAMKRQGVTL